MIFKKRVLITWLIVICYVAIIVSGCTNSQEDTSLHEETDLPEEKSSLPEEKPETSTTPQEHISENQMKTKTIPSGYLELTVSPAEIYSGAGEEVEIRCAIYSLVNTPVEITSVELVVFDSDKSLLREQAMTKDSYWSAHTSYTIAGDEAYYRLKVNFTTPLGDPGEYSEYSADSFPIVIKQEGG